MAAGPTRSTVRSRNLSATHADALKAAGIAAQNQRAPGQTDVIEYEDDKGKWHTETRSGSDRPATFVKDSEGSARWTATIRKLKLAPRSKMRSL
jgi:hypothetical protein